MNRLAGIGDIDLAVNLAVDLLIQVTIGQGTTGPVYIKERIERPDIVGDIYNESESPEEVSRGT